MLDSLTPATTTVEPGTDPGRRPAPPAPFDSTETVVETQALLKNYGRRVVALDRLTMEIPRTSVGLLGANGAGKTTLIRMLLGLSKPDGGQATVLGYDTRRDGIAIRQRVGYMPESDCLPLGATAADFVSHMAEMSGLPARAARQRAADVLYQVGLDEERYRLIKGFSTGMKQRVKLAQAIVHDPDLVFLDEPTNGMDPQGREDMLDLVSRIHNHLGICVLMSSHILEDIERVCRHVVILDAGRLVANQPIGDLGRRDEDLLIRVDGDPHRFAERLRAAGLTVRVEGLDSRDELTVLQNDDSVFDVIRDVAAEAEIPLRGLRSRNRSLEDLYLGSVGQPPESAEVSHGDD